MGNFCAIVGALVNRVRVEERFVLQGKSRVGGKDSIGANEVHECGGVKLENRGECGVGA